MIAFPGMLTNIAEEAGISTPSNLESYDHNDFVHFSVFCTLQLGRRIPDWGNSVRNNAAIIASIPHDKIRQITVGEVLAMGYE